MKLNGMFCNYLSGFSYKNITKHFNGNFVKSHYRNFGISGSYGTSIYGITSTDTNTRLIRLPKLPQLDKINLYPRLHVTQWPGNIRSLRGKYYFRDGQQTNTTYCQMLIKGTKDVCFVANINRNATSTPTIENCLNEQTRGFSGQILLEGRGVKAYFEPAWPHLMLRLGVGSSCIDATRVCTMYAKHVNVEINRSGLIISVHGYNKMMVGNVIYRLFKITRANPYTLKGGHIANYPIKCKKK